MASMAALNASMDAGFNEIIRLLRQQQGLPPAPPPFPQAAPKTFAPPPPAPLPAPLAAPPAPKPCAQTTPSELPPQPTSPAPVLTQSYPPPPSVETIEEVEQKQVYKPLRNVKQMRQKHGVSRRMRRIHDAEFFENCIAWPPKFGGTHMRFSRDEEPDAWYTTMLQAKAHLGALLNPA